MSNQDEYDQYEKHLEFKAEENKEHEYIETRRSVLILAEESYKKKPSSFELLYLMRDYMSFKAFPPESILKDFINYLDEQIEYQKSRRVSVKEKHHQISRYEYIKIKKSVDPAQAITIYASKEGIEPDSVRKRIKAFEEKNPWIKKLMENN